MVCHCLLIETDDGLVLIDTGLGQQIVQQRQAAIGMVFHAATRPRYDIRETAVAQIKALGFSPRDVRHIILTHLDPDHAGGIRDFPNARVHLHTAELAQARAPRLDQRSRYVPSLWASVRNWSTYEETGERWHGFEAVRDLDGLPPEILMIPLFGHSSGHCGVAVQTQSGWLLHAGDAYFHRHEVSHNGRCPAALRLQQTSIAYDNKLRLANRDRLRDLSLDEESTTTIFCAHDALEFKRLAAH